MLEVIDNTIHCIMTEAHPKAYLCLDFQRTFRLTNTEMCLPPGMGKYPISVLGPSELLIPMYQSEALWINIGTVPYPFALKVTYMGTSSITCVKMQPWIDICDKQQFVAPSLNGDPSFDYGFALEIFPMKADVFEHSPDETSRDVWDENHKQRIYVHLVNSSMWCGAGNEMLTVPLTDREYLRHGYPWLQKYEENTP